MTYQVEVIETLSRVVEVDAKSVEDAERMVRELYRSGEIVLGGDDCVDSEVRPLPIAPRQTD